MAMTVSTESEIAERIRSQVVARSGLSDLRETDPANQEIGATARDLNRVAIEQWEIRDEGMPSQCSDESLDLHRGEVLPAGMDRDEGDYALGGAFKFYRPVASAIVLTILKGTPVYRSKDGVTYRTLSDTTIGAGATESGAVSVICSIKGTSGNCAATEINRLGVPISGVTQCSNTSSIDNGADRQGRDDAYKAMRDYVTGISPCTRPGILYRVKQVDDATYGKVRHAKFGTVVAAQPGYLSLYIDDGMGTAGPLTSVTAGEVVVASAAGGETVLYLDNWPLAVIPLLSDNAVLMSPQPKWAYPWGQAQLSTGLTATHAITASAYTVYGGLVAVVQKVIDGDPSDAVNYPGIVGVGDILRVLPASLYGGILTYIDFAIWPKQGADKEALKLQAQRAVSQYVNSTDIGQKTYSSDIVAIVRGIALIENVTGVKFNGLTVDYIAPTDSQVVRTADSRITVT